MKHIEFKVPIYDIGIKLLLNCSEEEACNYFNKKYQLNIITNGYAGFNQLIGSPNNGKISLVWIKEFDWTIFSQKTLVHELTHTVFGILDCAGIPINFDNQESFTYLIDYIYGECLSKLKNLHPKLSSKKKSSKTKRNGKKSITHKSN